jgi:4-hydroxy-3-methylbut-2-enyl diphosphate reductase
MQVVRAQCAGFCSGVRRAVDMALNVSGYSRLFTVGKIIHNDAVLRRLFDAGFSVLDEDCLPDDLSGAVSVIRAHGVVPAVREALLSRGAVIVDATCPKVRKNQLLAKKIYDSGSDIFIAGEKNHAEVRGLLGFAPNGTVISNKIEADAAAAALFKENPQAKPEIIGQTTISNAEFTEICSSVLQFFPAARIYNTICRATRDRQDALAVLCSQVDAVIIAGDTKSANTQRLLSIAQSKVKAWICESAECIPPEIKDYKIVGLSAGASTPDEIIDDIERKLYE